MLVSLRRSARIKLPQHGQHVEFAIRDQEHSNCAGKCGDEKREGSILQQPSDLLVVTKEPGCTTMPLPASEPLLAAALSQPWAKQ